MKIEEMKEDKRDSWFPLSTGYNRLLVVLAITIIVVICCTVDTEQIFVVATLTLFVELCIYFAIVWVYRGFKNSINK